MKDSSFLIEALVEDFNLLVFLGAPQHGRVGIPANHVRKNGDDIKYTDICSCKRSELFDDWRSSIIDGEVCFAGQYSRAARRLEHRPNHLLSPASALFV